MRRAICEYLPRSVPSVSSPLSTSPWSTSACRSRKQAACEVCNRFSLNDSDEIVMNLHTFDSVSTGLNRGLLDGRLCMLLSISLVMCGSSDLGRYYAENSRLLSLAQESSREKRSPLPFRAIHDLTFGWVLFQHVACGFVNEPPERKLIIGLRSWAPHPSSHHHSI